MQAITTIYHGPTYSKGSRIIASNCDGKRLVMSYDCALNNDANHKKAALALRDKMGWKGRLIGGGIKNGMVWVFA